MTKIIKISGCGQCPHYWKRDSNHTSICKRESKIIDDPKSIPEWCPLEDADEYHLHGRIDHPF